MATIHYGLPQAHVKHYRAALRHGAPFGLLMAQMAQTYRTRKVMYDNADDTRLSDNRTVLPE